MSIRKAASPLCTPAVLSATSDTARLNAFLTGEQRVAPDSLPLLMATRAAVIEAHVACAFLPRAGAALAIRNQPFPEGFAKATLEHLQRCLGIVL